MKILIKIGSSLISKNHRLDKEFLKAKVKEIAELINQGNELILVSSGAVASGMEVENLIERPKDSFALQLLSGEGQILLMKNYKELFDEEKIKITQVLLTHHNFDTEEERKTIIEIINAYLKNKIVPIINENDLINKEELEKNALFTDNDILSALVAKSIKADLGILLTDVDGLYDVNPKNNEQSNLIEEVLEINDFIQQSASKETNGLGKGGMSSKVSAAKIMTDAGIKTIIANGNYNLSDIINGKVKRTLFKR